MSWYFIDSQSRVTVPTGTYLDLGSNGWSLSCWYKILGTGENQQHYFYSRSGAGLAEANQPTLRINESTNIVTWAVWDSNIVSIDTTYDPGTTNEWTASGWTHTVVTVSSANAASRTGNLTKYTNLYINGNLVGSDLQDGFANLTGVNLIFGRRGNASLGVANLSLTGCLAEFAKFDRVLSKTEVSQLYRGHDPELLSNGALACYYPMRNDFIDKVTGRTGVQVNVFVTGDHPVPDKTYIATNDRQITLPQLDGRVGVLEQRGLIDFFDWTPGTIAPTDFATTGAILNQVKVGDGYVIAPNRSLSGGVLSCYARSGNGTSSGILHSVIANPNPLLSSISITLDTPIRFNVYRL